jgi:hypothetical protein
VGAVEAGAGNVLQTAFDPQSALYQKYLGLMQQQSNAQMAGSGVGSSPYAAGLNNQRLTDFNTSWQAQQLQNQIAGLGAAGGAQSTATNMYGPAANLAFQSGAMPYQAYNQIQQSPMAALLQQLQYGQAGAQIPEQQIQDYMALLGLQPALAGAQNQTATTQARLQAQELAQLGQGVGTGVNLLGMFS